MAGPGAQFSMEDEMDRFEAEIAGPRLPLSASTYQQTQAQLERQIPGFRPPPPPAFIPHQLQQRYPSAVLPHAGRMSLTGRLPPPPPGIRPMAPEGMSFTPPPPPPSANLTHNAYAASASALPGADPTQQPAGMITTAVDPNMSRITGTPIVIVAPPQKYKKEKEKMPFSSDSSASMSSIATKAFVTRITPAVRSQVPAKTLQTRLEKQEENKPMSSADAFSKAKEMANKVNATTIVTKIHQIPKQGKREKKPKKIIRVAGGEVWEDSSLLEWDPDDFRLFCGDLGNDVNDDVLTRAFNKYSSFVKAKVVKDKRTGKTKGFGFVSFKDPKDYVRAMREMNGKYVGSIKRPTPVQANCIPPILEGKDCIGCAKTGSGKTLAFALPILQNLSNDPYGIFALVLTPTRELAYQIADQFRVYGKPVGLKDAIIVGGRDMVEQGLALSRNPHIVIATPGRLADHISSCDTFSLTKIKFLVLDEADRLFDGQYDEQLEKIFQVLPKSRQTLLFSATLTDTLQNLRTVATKEPFFWEDIQAVKTVETLNQKYILCPSHVKDGYLVYIIKEFREKNPTGSIIVFTGTCKSCQILYLLLHSLGFSCRSLNSRIKQRERLTSIAMFKSTRVQILVATDVASRGLDIPEVELVLNYNVPPVAKDYIHRVGRTGRAGRGGLAVTLLSPEEIPLLQEVEKVINTRISEQAFPDKEVVKILTQVAVTRRQCQIKLEESEFELSHRVNKRKKLILEGKDPDEEERKKSQRMKQWRKQGLKASLTAKSS
ncbi:unnamed protein product [Darwinula stevensoni]|uniref:RNA-binding protein 42 n=1 Tax=Darwinula stevensoni TaxID=69355 RepID=A0A7R8X8P5_9CRUS|nr:unnamed protein product [Darwinula stevensoni]CAG0890348.1 unnamed protein product [Darwinula stevensoni]